MPVRPRRRRIGRAEWSPRVAIALTIGPTPGENLTDAQLKESWEAHQARIMDNQHWGARPWAWWRFDRRVPPHLKAQRPALTPVDNTAVAKLEADKLEAEQAAWLRATFPDEHAATPVANGHQNSHDEPDPTEDA